MTLGGVLAAVFGLCAALVILYLRVRDHNSGERQVRDNTPKSPVPTQECPEYPISAGPTMPEADTASLPDSMPSAGEEAAAKRPATAFKPYVPPRKP